MQLSTKHLLGIRDLKSTDIQLILDTATQFKEVLQRPIKKVPTLRDVTIVNLFYENSTRTRISFEVGVHELGGQPLVLRPDEMQISRGEALRDTALVLSRHVGAIGLRTGLARSPVEITVEPPSFAVIVLKSSW